MFYSIFTIISNIQDNQECYTKLNQYSKFNLHTEKPSFSPLLWNMRHWDIGTLWSCGKQFVRETSTWLKSRIWL